MESLSLLQPPNDASPGGKLGDAPASRPAPADVAGPSSVRASTPAESSDIAALRKELEGLEDDLTCCVTLDAMDKDAVRLEPCGHWLSESIAIEILFGDRENMCPKQCGPIVGYAADPEFRALATDFTLTFAQGVKATDAQVCLDFANRYAPLESVLRRLPWPRPSQEQLPPTASHHTQAADPDFEASVALARQLQEGSRRPEGPVAAQDMPVHESLAMAEALAASADPDHRLTAVDILRGLGAPAQTLLQRLAGDPDPMVQQAAAAL